VTRRELPVRYLRLAEEDLYEIYDYLAGDDPGAAAAFLEELDARIGRLAAHPELGPRVREERLSELGYRRLVIGGYLAFYKVEEDGILVHRVLHGARDWVRLM